MKTETRKPVSIRLPAATWRRAKAAAVQENTPLWLWIVHAIEYKLTAEA